MGGCDEGMLRSARAMVRIMVRHASLPSALVLYKTLTLVLLVGKRL